MRNLRIAPSKGTFNKVLRTLAKQIPHSKNRNNTIKEEREILVRVEAQVEVKKKIPTIAKQEMHITPNGQYGALIQNGKMTRRKGRQIIHNIVEIGAFTLLQRNRNNQNNTQKPHLHNRNLHRLSYAMTPTTPHSGGISEV